MEINLLNFVKEIFFQFYTENKEHTVSMELNNGDNHVSIETVYHKILVLRGHSFMLVTKLNSINLDLD
jgi:hypothetical protein